MGRWATATLYQTTNLAALTLALEAVFDLDGYRRIEKPAPEVCAERIFRQVYDDFLAEPLWGAVFRTGAHGWTFGFCTPFYVLCDRSLGVPRPRLAELARLLRCQAFMYCVYDSTDASLLECRPDGSIHVSGTRYSSLDALYDDNGDRTDAELIEYYQERIRADDTLARFQLLDVPAECNQLLDTASDAAVDRIGEHFLGVSASRFEDWSGEVYPFSDTNPTAPGIVELYFERDTK